MWELGSDQLVKCLPHQSINDYVGLACFQTVPLVALTHPASQRVAILDSQTLRRVWEARNVTAFGIACCEADGHASLAVCNYVHSEVDVYRYIEGEEGATPACVLPCAFPPSHASALSYGNDTLLAVADDTVQESGAATLRFFSLNLRREVGGLRLTCGPTTKRSHLIASNGIRGFVHDFGPCPTIGVLERHNVHRFPFAQWSRKLQNGISGGEQPRRFPSCKAKTSNYSPTRILAGCSRGGSAALIALSTSNTISVVDSLSKSVIVERPCSSNVKAVAASCDAIFYVDADSQLHRLNFLHAISTGLFTSSKLHINSAL